MLRGLKPLMAALLALAAPLAAQDLPRDPPGADDLAVMGTIPIYWGDRGEFTDLLSGGDEGHWARPVIEQNWRLRPLDYLSADALQGHMRLLLAQPRGLSAEENVALDAWVRRADALPALLKTSVAGAAAYAAMSAVRASRSASASSASSGAASSGSSPSSSSARARARSLHGKARPSRLVRQAGRAGRRP